VLLYSLKDSDDDVRAVASDTLLPIATEAASLVRDQMPEILSILWDILLELDQLTASTNSVMNLLGMYAGITCIQHFLILTLLSCSVCVRVCVCSGILCHSFDCDGDIASEFDHSTSFVCHSLGSMLLFST